MGLGLTDERVVPEGLDWPSLMALDGDVGRVRIGDIAAIADPHRGTVIAREASPV